jgi:uncharacterized membrane protein YcaP (DUF421 family)
MDLIFALLIAEAAAHSLGDYKAVGDGLTLIVFIMGFNYPGNALSYHVPFIERLVSAPPLRIIRDGELLRRNMRREYLTEEELVSYLRQQGIDEIGEVKAAFVEGEGEISVIKKSGGRK